MYENFWFVRHWLPWSTDSFHLFRNMFLYYPRCKDIRCLINSYLSYLFIMLWLWFIFHNIVHDNSIITELEHIAHKEYLHISALCIFPIKLFTANIVWRVLQFYNLLSVTLNHFRITTMEVFLQQLEKNKK